MSSIAKTTTKRAPRARQGRLKSVTFTGCWTCRSRKVKCDERQENGCVACEKAGVNCEGYQVKFCWVTGKDQNPHGFQRRKIRLDPSSISPCIPDEEINQILSDLDTVSSCQNTITVGPFSIFHALPTIMDVKPSKKHFSEDKPAGAPALSDDEIFRSVLDNLWSRDEDCMLISETAFPQHDQGHSGPSISPILDDSLANSTTSTFDQGSDPLESSMSLIIAGLDRTYDIHTNEPNIYPTRSHSPRMSIGGSLIPDTNTSMLMYHYTKHVAELLQPVLHPRNPWRTTYFQFALQGCPDFSSNESSGPAFKVSTAIFHSVLSSAAFHLRNATGGSAKFHKLGLRQRAKSLQALNSAILDPWDSKLYTAYLTAMLSLVTIDTMTGEDSDFPIHLNGCRQLTSSVQNGIDGHSNQVRSICHVLTLLARTTSYKLLGPPRHPANQFHEPPYFHEEDTSIEYIYGITPALGNLLQRTCDLAECLSTYTGYDIPMELFEARETLKVDILTWEISSEQLKLMESGNTMSEIARCQARAFHSAVLIYFHRAVLNEDPKYLDDEVRIILSNLTAAEDLKDQYMGGDKRTAPMSWPFFIASCEASDRQPWVEWWTRIQEYKIGNFRRQWMVVQELWDIMDKEDNVNNWKDALEKSGILVLPI